MNPRSFSLILAGLIWIAVGMRIGSRALGWLEPYFVEPNWRLGLLVVSLIIGLGKAFTVLRKAVNRNLGNLDKIDNSPVNYLIGWLKLFGTKGVIIITIMIGLGYGLRYLRSIGLDTWNLFGFLYMGIAIGLIVGSVFYFKALPMSKAASEV